MIDSHLKIAVNGQVNVVSGGCLGLRNHLHDISHVVDHQILVTLVSLEFQFHGCLNAGTADNIAEFILRICLFELLQLVLLYLTGVADDRRKILCVIIAADSRLCHLHTLQLRSMFHQICYGLIIHPVTDGNRLIFFICDK